MKCFVNSMIFNLLCNNFNVINYRQESIFCAHVRRHVHCLQRRISVNESPVFSQSVIRISSRLRYWQTNRATAIVYDKFSGAVICESSWVESTSPTPPVGTAKCQWKPKHDSTKESKWRIFWKIHWICNIWLMIHLRSTKKNDGKQKYASNFLNAHFSISFYRSHWFLSCVKNRPFHETHCWIQLIWSTRSKPC